MKSLFKPLAFGGRLRRLMRARGVSLREVEAATGVDHATIGRVCGGKAPSVENYLRIMGWMRVSE
jgi:transcriptional regulator with XRE-family HTH domain